MDWQLVAVAGAVVGATAYVVRATWRSWAGGCATGCGKCATPTPEPIGRRIALPLR